MKRLKIQWILGFTLLIFGCGTTQKIVEPNAELDQMVAERTFRIDAEWVRPLVTNSLSQVVSSGLLPPGNTAGQINIAGDGSYFKMEGDSVTADLPYFGERQMSGGYNNRTGIAFDGEPQDLKIVKNEEKQTYELDFNIRNESEVYRVKIWLFHQTRATILVNSSQRFSIRYDGRLSKIPID